MNPLVHDYKRFQGESDEELIYRITSDKEKIGSWQDVADILNELLGTEYTESKFRKQRQAFDKMLAANMGKFADTEKQIKEIELQKRELERAKIQFRDERNAWQRQNYSAARADQCLDYLEKQMKNLGRTYFDVAPIQEGGDDSTSIIVPIADLHIGMSFDSYWGKYNTEIAKKEINWYLNKVIDIAKTHNAKTAYVLCLGDEISGNIHKTIQVQNRENIIDQIKIASEFISSFCYELSRVFTDVYFYSVNGNHSRIDKKKDAVKDERLDDIVSWSVGNMLHHIENFHPMLDSNIDSTIGQLNIFSKHYVFVHGELDNLTTTGVGNLSTMLGFVPDYIISAHRHTSAYSCNGVDVYQTGSFVPSGDDHTIQSRLCGSASQTVLVCDYDGVKCSYNVKLS